jgi:hypothetical protein
MMLRLTIRAENEADRAGGVILFLRLPKKPEVQKPTKKIEMKAARMRKCKNWTPELPGFLYLSRSR